MTIIQVILLICALSICFGIALFLHSIYLIGKGALNEFN